MFPLNTFPPRSVVAYFMPNSHSTGVTYLSIHIIAMEMGKCFCFISLLRRSQSDAALDVGCAVH